MIKLKYILKEFALRKKSSLPPPPQTLHHTTLSTLPSPLYTIMRMCFYFVISYIHEHSSLPCYCAPDLTLDTVVCVKTLGEKKSFNKLKRHEQPTHSILQLQLSNDRKNQLRRFFAVRSYSYFITLSLHYFHYVKYTENSHQ